MKKIFFRREVWDLAFSLSLVAGCLVVINETEKIGESPFDQLGAAFFPQLIAFVLISLSIVVIVKNLILLKDLNRDLGVVISLERKVRAIQVSLISLLAIIFIIGISLKTIPFSILVGAFLSASIFVLNRYSMRRMMWVVLGSFAGGGVLEFLFTRVFVMDLPRF